MIRDIIRGILADYQGKPLTKKRVDELTARLATAVQMVKAAEPVQFEPTKNKVDAIAIKTIKEKNSNPNPGDVSDAPIPEIRGSKVETIQGVMGNKAFVSVPEPEPVVENKRKEKVQKKPPVAIIALPTGALGQGYYEGKRTNDDVGAFSIRPNP